MQSHVSTTNILGHRKQVVLISVGSVKRKLVFSWCKTIPFWLTNSWRFSWIAAFNRFIGLNEHSTCLNIMSYFIESTSNTQCLSNPPDESMLLRLSRESQRRMWSFKFFRLNREASKHCRDSLNQMFSNVALQWSLDYF